MANLNSNLDKVQVQNHATDKSVSAKLSEEASDALRAKGASTTHKDSPPAPSTPKDTLPSLTITHPQAPAKSNWFSGIEKSAAGALNVASDIGKGAVNEVIHHPGTILKDAAIGVAAGAAAVVGAALLPEGLAGLAIVGGVAAAGGAIAGGYEVIKHGGITNTTRDVVAGAKNLVHEAQNLGHNFAVEYDPTSHSKAEHQKAKASLEGVGAAGAQIAAGTAGVFAGSGIAQVVRGAISAAADGAASTASTASTATAETAETTSKSLVAGPIENAKGAPFASVVQSSLKGGFPSPTGVEALPSQASVGHGALVASSAEREAEISAKATAEFGPLSASDRPFALNLAEQAERDGYKSPALWGLYNLTDSAKIDQFVNMYNASADFAVRNMKLMVNGGRVMEGTEPVWKAALAKLG